jgi:hypothetical protein
MFCRFDKNRSIEIIVFLTIILLSLFAKLTDEDTAKAIVVFFRHRLNHRIRRAGWWQDRKITGTSNP